eukprot:SAG31_NODE_3895_length_3773_cov_21.681818_6_plen_62_part_00
MLRVVQAACGDNRQSNKCTSMNNVKELTAWNETNLSCTQRPSGNHTCLRFAASSRSLLTDM